MVIRFAIQMADPPTPAISNGKPPSRMATYIIAAKAACMMAALVEMQPRLTGLAWLL
jgi:hypothetical protein